VGATSGDVAGIDSVRLASERDRGYPELSRYVSTSAVLTLLCVCFVFCVRICTRQRTGEQKKPVFAECEHAVLPPLAALFRVCNCGQCEMGSSSGAAPYVCAEAAPQRCWWSMVLRSADIVTCVVSRAAVPVFMWGLDSFFPAYRAEGHAVI